MKCLDIEIPARARPAPSVFGPPATRIKTNTRTNTNDEHQMICCLLVTRCNRCNSWSFPTCTWERLRRVRMARRSRSLSCLIGRTDRLVQPQPQSTAASCTCLRVVAGTCTQSHQTRFSPPNRNNCKIVPKAKLPHQGINAALVRDTAEDALFIEFCQFSNLIWPDSLRPN
jgi:hypothetical protein